MSECPEAEYLLVVPRLKVQNANAISSPQTHGFPAMTAFLGLMWALERKSQSEGLDLQFDAVGVVAHSHQEQTSDDYYAKSFRLTRNPVNKDGKTAAIVEEGRMHLELSLVFAVRSDQLYDEDDKQKVTEKVNTLIHQMRIAGGSIIPTRFHSYRHEPFIALASDFNAIKPRLVPGFTLVERQDALDKRHDELKLMDDKATRLDAWLSLSRINWQYVAEKNGDKGEWLHDRSGLGWLVPIPLGYGALTDIQEPGSVANARDSNIPFCFVESLYGIGEWISPHRLNKAEQFLWYADSRPEEGLYRCRNDYRFNTNNLLRLTSE